MAEAHDDGGPGARSIRERGKAERRVRVVEAAIEMLAVGGVDALSMRSLSAEAGVSVPAIYNLIGGRDDVLAAVLDRLATVFDAEVATLSTDPIDRCFDIADRLVDTLTANPTMTRSIVAEGLTPVLARTDTSLLWRYGVALLSALVEADDRDQIAPVTHLLVIVDQLVSLTAVRIFRWASADPDDDPDGRRLHAAVEHGLGLMVAGVASDSERARIHARVRVADHRLTAEWDDGRDGVT